MIAAQYSTDESARNLEDKAALVRCMPQAAAALLGERNAALSKANEWRYGTHGSLQVLLNKGVWHDHETDQRGGVIELVRRERKCSKAEAITWLEDTAGLPKREKRSKSDFKIVATYDYEDANGNLVFQVCRLDPKSFRQRRRPRDDDPPKAIKYGWVWSGPEKKLPYRLPDLQEKLALEKPVFVVEGEKAANRLWNEEIAATCSPGGACKWTDDVSAHLKGAHIVILPDNDKPGRDHCAVVGRSLQGVAASVRVLDLPDLPEKGDVFDWFEAGGSVDELLRMAETARPFVQQRAANGHAKDDARTQQERLEAEFRERVGDAQEEAPAKQPIVFEWFENVEPDPDEWLIYEVLPLRGLAMILGASQSGKTFVALDLLLRTAARMPVLSPALDNELPEHVGVAYVAGEGTNGVKKRMKAFRQHYEIKAQIPFALTVNSLDLRDPKAEDVDRLIAELKNCQKAMRKRGARLGVVCIDTLASVTPGANESTSEGMGAAIAACKRIADELGILVIIVHHVGWSDEDRERGWSGLRGALDASILIKRDKATGVRSVRLKKQKDGADERELAEFELKRVVIGTDGRKREISSCVIEAYEAPDPQAATQAKTMKAPPQGVPKVRKALEQLISEGGQHPPRACQAGQAMGVLKDDLKVRARSLGLCGDSVKDPTGSSLRAFNRAMHWLTETGHEMHEREGWVWFSPGHKPDKSRTSPGRSRSR